MRWNSRLYSLIGGQTQAGLEFASAQAVKEVSASARSVHRFTKLGIFDLHDFLELVVAFGVASGLFRAEEDGGDCGSEGAPAEEAQGVAGEPVGEQRSHQRRPSPHNARLHVLAERDIERQRVVDKIVFEGAGCVHAQQNAARRIDHAAFAEHVRKLRQDRGVAGHRARAHDLGADVRDAVGEVRKLQVGEDQITKPTIGRNIARAERHFYRAVRLLILAARADADGAGIFLHGLRVRSARVVDQLGVRPDLPDGRDRPRTERDGERDGIGIARALRPAAALAHMLGVARFFQFRRPDHVGKTSATGIGSSHIASPWRMRLLSGIME